MTSATAFRWLAFVACVVLFVWGPFVAMFEAVERYGYLADIMPSDWLATNLWLDTTDCALQRGVWLALCEDGKLVPLSERAIADDPGHAFLLDLWSMAIGRRATLPDVARLNTLVDAAGLVGLAGLFFALRAYATAIVLLVLGPPEYLGWMGTSPHWSFIGVVSLCAVLPIALIARDRGLLSPRSGTVWVVAGLVFLALATLIRESMGLMGFLLSLLSVGALALIRPRTARRLAGFALTGVLVLGAFSSAKWVVMARDAAFDMQPATRLATHGLSHTLYLGLGTIENKWGIRYDDDYGREVAQQIDPDIVFCSPEYFRVMWRLYLSRWLDDPVEVLRIYLEKAIYLATTPTLFPGPPFGVVLLIGLIHLGVATALGLWRKIGFEQGFVIELVAVGFIGLFLAQSMAALSSQTYAMPVNAFVLTLAGVIVEFMGRSALSLLPSYAGEVSRLRRRRGREP